jgi:predicted esterase
MDEFIKKYKNLKNYEIIDYDKIKLIKIIISNNNKPLVIIPPYSFNGFQKIMITLNNNFDIIQKKYNIIYALCWDDNIKKESQKRIDGITDVQKQYKINEIFRSEMATIANNILKIQKIKNFTLLGKSAGGGVAIYITKKNKQVNNLFLIAPGILKTNIKLNKDIRIILSWSIDDDIIPYEKSLALIKNYIKNKNNFMFISFQDGGHELHENFFKSIN